MAWKSDELKVDIKHSSSQIIHIEVSPLVGEKFHCSFVYGASDKKGRKELFDHLGCIKQHVTVPWLVMGDFNCIANIEERMGQRPRHHELEPLRNCMANC